MDQDFVPLDFVKRGLRLWWLVAVGGIIGGLIGLGFSRLRPPLYQSEAVYLAELDLLVLGDTPYSEYDIDLALAAIQAAFIKVRPQVVEDARQAGIAIDLPGIVKNSAIERLHAHWMVRFRHPDPAVAQQVVALWTARGDAMLAEFQAAGKIKVYVRYSQVSPADLPTRPLYFGVSSLALAGCVVGLVIGALLTAAWDRLAPHRQPPASHDHRSLKDGDAAA